MISIEEAEKILKEERCVLCGEKIDPPARRTSKDLPICDQCFKDVYSESDEDRRYARRGF